MVAVLGGLASLAYANIGFYFHGYYANPENLRSQRYKAAQRLYEVQTVQSRYMASLGKGFRVVCVGQSPYPYDADTTRYLAPGQEYIIVHDPREQLPVGPAPGKALAFLFFPGNEQYREVIRERYPAGRAGEVRTPVGRLVFYTYLVPPEVVPKVSINFNRSGLGVVIYLLHNRAAASGSGSRSTAEAMIAGHDFSLFE